MLKSTHLFLEVLYSTLSMGLHDSFLPSFCIFPELEEIAKEWTTFQDNTIFTVNKQQIITISTNCTETNKLTVLHVRSFIIRLVSGHVPAQELYLENKVSLFPFSTSLSEFCVFCFQFFFFREQQTIVRVNAFKSYFFPASHNYMILPLI